MNGDKPNQEAMEGIIIKIDPNICDVCGANKIFCRCEKCGDKDCG